MTNTDRFQSHKLPHAPMGYTPSDSGVMTSVPRYIFSSSWRRVRNVRSVSTEMSAIASTIAPAVKAASAPIVGAYNPNNSYCAYLALSAAVANAIACNKKTICCLAGVEDKCKVRKKNSRAIDISNAHRRFIADHVLHLSTGLPIPAEGAADGFAAMVSASGLQGELANPSTGLDAFHILKPFLESAGLSTLAILKTTFTGCGQSSNHGGGRVDVFLGCQENTRGQKVCGLVACNMQHAWALVKNQDGVWFKVDEHEIIETKAPSRNDIRTLFPIVVFH